MRDGLVEDGDLTERLMEGKKERFTPIITDDFWE
jgi:hypothetical protein